MATARECVLMMGVPSVPGGPLVGKWQCSVPHYDVLDGMDCYTMQKLTGNGQHMAAIGAWQLYCLANTMLKSDVVFDPDQPLDTGTACGSLQDGVSCCFCFVTSNNSS